MNRLALLIVFFPVAAFASLTGVDDLKPNLNGDDQDRIDNAVMTYYQDHSAEKVNTVLDMMTTTKLLRKKTAWPPLIGFLTVVFAANKDHVMGWISRNDYDEYSIDVIVAALMHARLKDTAVLFAKAEQWKPEDIAHLEITQDTTDLKKLPVVVPGHIDTLWGAFFGSGDVVYVNEVIDVLFMTSIPGLENVGVPPHADVLGENKKLAENTLRQYAVQDERVRGAISARIAKEKDQTRKKVLEALLPQMTPIPKTVKQSK